MQAPDDGLHNATSRAAELAGLLADPAAGTVAALRAAEELRSLADGILATTAARAHAGGLSWQDIGNQLGISRQAAFQRFSGGAPPPAGPRRGDRELIARARDIFTAIDAGDAADVAADFTPRMARQVTVEDLAGVWADCVGTLGAYGRATAATVRHNGSVRVVHCSLVFAQGVLDGRVAFNRSRRIAGLLVTDPGFGPPAAD